MMAKWTMVFGAVLVVLGVAFFCMTGCAHPTALIPTWFGLVLIVCGMLAATEDAKRRMLWMHIAVTAGLLGCIVPGVRVGMGLAKMHSGGEVAKAALQEQMIMAGICVVFVAICVRSFIAARRGRVG